MTDEQFNKMPDKYIKDLRDDFGCSLPTNFEGIAQLIPPSQQDLTNDISLLASLLGNFQPPRTCAIQQLDRQSIETLSLPNNLKPIHFVSSQQSKYSNNNQ
eukprot:UN10052